MSTSHLKTVSPNSRLAATAFYLINFLLFPLTLIGYALHIGHLYFGRQQGVSTSAQATLSARWAQHHLGAKEDEAASRLMASLLGKFPLGWYLAAGPMLLAHRLTGFVPKAFRYPYEGEVDMQYQASARQTFFDAVVERYLAYIPQFVILGAGFDTRAYQLPKRAHVRVSRLTARKRRRSSARF